MKKFKIVCIAQIYNELQKGNLERFIKYVIPLIDELVIYDDGSTDGSYEYVKKFTKYIIKGDKNKFENEMFHKDLLLKKALTLNPDFIFYLDVDEVFSAGGRKRLEEVCDWMIKEDLDGTSFHKLNLWRSNSWRRVDSLFDVGWFTHLWRVKSGMKYIDLKPGLHQAPYPSTVKKIKRSEEFSIIHYGFSNIKNISYKYLTYKNYAQRGYDELERLIDERKLKLKKVPKDVFPKGLWKDDKKPNRIQYEDFMIKVLSYRKNPKNPKYSIFSLIYRSTDWLKFSYSQLAKYTNISESEIYYIANDASPEVLRYLRLNKIPYHDYKNSAKERKDWYINNVYRAYNFGAKKAKGNLLVLINSDMAFNYDWMTDLKNKYNGKNCVVSRMVESGKLPSGKYAISKNFGRSISSYKEEKFLKFANRNKINVLKNGGLYGPLLINKKDFLSVGGYPEGNVLPGSNIFSPRIARKGEYCIPGDEILMRKLAKKNIKHQTDFNSIIYHFQGGESEENSPFLKKLNLKKIIKKLRF